MHSKPNSCSMSFLIRCANSDNDVPNINLAKKPTSIENDNLRYFVEKFNTYLNLGRYSVFL